MGYEIMKKIPTLFEYYICDKHKKPREKYSEMISIFCKKKITHKHDVCKLSFCYAGIIDNMDCLL